MRLKLLLFSLVVSCGFLNAQDTIRTLIISEARLDGMNQAYVELSNVGDEAINLSEFEFGKVDPWTDPYAPAENIYFRLPDRVLQPGESFVMATVYDFGPEMWLLDREKYSRKISKDEWYDIADLRLHVAEPNGWYPADSVTPWYHVLEVWNGRDCLYLEHHPTEEDSVVIDQVNGIFDEENGTSTDEAHDVAGVIDATNNSTLVRKFTVKTGNLDFDNARGIDLTDGEWMPIPRLFGNWEPNRAVFWTAGNHGDYNLTESTLVSETVDIDWSDSTLTVPWGVRNDDSLMFQFDKTPGLAWHYHYSENHEDSGYVSARTGDILTVYACGNDLDIANFKVVVAEPTADANIVIPKRVPGEDGWYGQWAGAPFIVTDGEPGGDVIKEVAYGYRTDSLFKYLEKAPNAEWEMVWKDGIEQTAVRTGDILKVTAENGDEKEYTIEVEDYIPNHNPFLSSITWPDIPEFYKDVFGWIGDTIPNFSSQKYGYKVQVPIDVEGIPALVAKPQDLNTNIEVDKAISLKGTPEQRTVTFNTTAEDDTTKAVYTIQFDKEQNPDNEQPWKGEPFISEFVFWEQWNNGFIEFVNPGTEPLDFSDYMIFGQWANDPAAAITWFAEPEEATWNNRYVKYIPGYKWVDLNTWLVEPATVVQDLNVNPIIQPGDVFVIGDIRTTDNSGYPWFASEQCDIDFNHNPWDEPLVSDAETCARQWSGANIYLYKILNDSIKQGLKAATDPNDFELIDTWGMGDGTTWVVGGVVADMINSWQRKPDVYEGKTGFAESFGTNAEDSEWLFQNTAYWQARNAGWPNEILYVASDLGSHFMNEVTVGYSTVNSIYYKTSNGYSMEETIEGVKTGTTAGNFLDNIVKKNDGQTLMVISGTSGDTLTSELEVADGDTLAVLSADDSNNSKYILSVGEGLSGDAVLTSSSYTISVDGSNGTVGGYDYGTTIATVVDNVTLPTGATMTIVDENGAYVPMKMLNFDTTYVDAMAKTNVYFEVVAEDAMTTITYQLVPNAQETDAFILSDIYGVDQDASLISYLPRGTTAEIFMNNITAVQGASVKIVDKLGHERTTGELIKDDRIVVTASDGETTKTYYLSMLQDETFLAYVLSDMFSVDQLEMDISGGINDETTLTDFYNNLMPAEGATVVVLDTEGNENTTGTLNEGDYLRVTSGDGVTVVYYTITLIPVGINSNSIAINIYPNPSTGIVNVAGLENGSRIHVYNSVGVKLRDVKVHQALEQISLDDQPAGIYFIVVSDSEKVIGRYKLLMK